MRADVMAGWLEPEEKIGELDVRFSHGREVFALELDGDWITNHRSLVLDPDLSPFRGVQYPYPGRAMFGFLSDAAPDRWGRRLIERASHAIAEKNHTAVRGLHEADYLFGVSDPLRYGGLRFRDRETGRYMSSGSEKVPPLADIRMLEEAVRGYEMSAKDDAFLRLLVDPGSSLGGARPKANVIDSEGQLWIAKFPSKTDEYDIGAWEMAEHELAVSCGLDVPDAKLMQLSEHGSTFLTRRFDREHEHRVHAMSFMTALDMTDGHTDGTGYMDMAGQLEVMSACPGEDLQELWKRLAFNVLTSNCDDHLRNHGLVLRDDGWRLAPAYDLNPAPEKDSLSLDILDGDRRKDIRHVLEIAPLFRIPESASGEIIRDMQIRIGDNWEETAFRCRISERSIRHMAPAFAECHRELNPTGRMVPMAGKQGARRNADRKR